MATKGKKEDNEPKHGRCYDCKIAYLMQSQSYNPIIALCEKTQERWVASMDPNCGVFEKRVGEPEIHPMIHLYNKN